MILTPAVVARDALALFKRDRSLLIALAGPFWFLPAYAVALLVPPPPARPATEADATLAWAESLTAWMGAQAHWYLLAWGIGIWGTATAYRLYLDDERPDLRAALRDGAALWPRLALASALTALAAGAGLLLWVLPGLYLLGRLFAVGPALAAERPLSALGALGRSFRITRGAGLTLMAVAAATLGAAWLLGRPLALVEGWVRAQDGGNPVMIALIGAAGAAVSAAAALASALLAVAAYRRLAR
jgi:hypothetical protein